MKKIICMAIVILSMINLLSSSALARSGAKALAVGSGYVAVTSDFRTGVSIWDVKTGAYLRTLWRDAPFFANNLLIEGPYLYAGLSDGRVVVVEISGGSTVWESKHHQSMIFDMTIINGTLYTTPEMPNDDGLAISEKTTGKLLSRLKVTRGALVAGDEKRFVVGLDDNKYRIYDHRKLAKPKTVRMKDYLYTRIVLKGNHIYASTNRNRLHMLDLETGKVLKRLDMPLFDFAVGEQVIASAIRTGQSKVSKIVILDEYLNLQRTIDLNASSDLGQVALSDDGALLAIDGSSLWVWNVHTGQLLLKIDDTRTPMTKGTP